MIRTECMIRRRKRFSDAKIDTPHLAWFMAICDRCGGNVHCGGFVGGVAAGFTACPPRFSSQMYNLSSQLWSHTSEGSHSSAATPLSASSFLRSERSYRRDVKVQGPSVESHVLMGGSVEFPSGADISAHSQICCRGSTELWILRAFDQPCF